MECCNSNFAYIQLNVPLCISRNSIRYVVNHWYNSFIRLVEGMFYGLTARRENSGSVCNPCGGGCLVLPSI